MSPLLVVGNGGVIDWFSKIKLYFFDGFMEVTIAIFSLVIVYKIIVTFHNSLLDAIEIQGNRTMDDAVESMKSEAAGWGNRV